MTHEQAEELRKIAASFRGMAKNYDELKVKTFHLEGTIDEISEEMEVLLRIRSMGEGLISSAGEVDGLADILEGVK